VCNWATMTLKQLSRSSFNSFQEKEYRAGSHATSKSKLRHQLKSLKQQERSNEKRQKATERTCQHLAFLKKALESEARRLLQDKDNHMREVKQKLSTLQELQKDLETRSELKKKLANLELELENCRDSLDMERDKASSFQSELSKERVENKLSTLSILSYLVKNSTLGINQSR